MIYRGSTYLQSRLPELKTGSDNGITRTASCEPELSLSDGLAVLIDILARETLRVLIAQDVGSRTRE